MRVWFEDLERAIAAVRAKDRRRHLFCSISVNLNGDFVFEIDKGCQYLVKHEDFSVWENSGNSWRELR